MKKILLAIIFCLSVSTTAKAECAWVLWEREMGKGYGWTILEAYPKYDQCKGAQKHRLEQLKESFERIKNGAKPIKRISTNPSIIILDYEDGSQRSFETQCLPDTIDPRK